MVSHEGIPTAPQPIAVPARPAVPPAPPPPDEEGAAGFAQLCWYIARNPAGAFAGPDLFDPKRRPLGFGLACNLLAISPIVPALAIGGASLGASTRLGPVAAFAVGLAGAVVGVGLALASFWLGWLWFLFEQRLVDRLGGRPLTSNEQRATYCFSQAPSFLGPVAFFVEALFSFPITSFWARHVRASAYVLRCGLSPWRAHLAAFLPMAFTLPFFTLTVLVLSGFFAEALR